MTDVPNMPGTGPDSGKSAIDGTIARAKGILLTPNEEWPKIEAEPTTPRQILVRYVLPLAAIGPVAGFLGSQIFGYGALGFKYTPSLVSSLGTAINTYVVMIVGIVGLSLLADFLAPRFAGRPSKANAAKLAAYSATAAMLAGVFQIVPSLAFLSILGFYGVYLLYLGAGPLMKVPQDKAVAYTAVTIVCALVVLVVIGTVGRAVVGALVPGPTYMSETGGTVTVPGVGRIDLDKAQKAADEMEAAANGRKPAVEPSKLQGLLPATVGGYQRTAVEATSLGGIGSEATGTYEAGGKSFRLKITDMPAVGAIAGIGTAIGVSQSREDAEGYERTGAVNGRMQSEKWRKSGSGLFSVVIANRFTVEAEGSAASIGELKSAVAAIDERALTGLVAS